MQAATCDVVGGDASVAVSDASIQIQQHKQHAIPQIMRDDEARVRIKACCLDESDIRVSCAERGRCSDLRMTTLLQQHG